MIFNTRHLLSAMKVREFGTLTETSQYIHLSQSALTQGINKLESQLGHIIFERTQSGMFTTDVGDVFLKRVTRAFDYLLSFANNVFEKSAKRKEGFLRLITTRQLIALITVVDTGNYTNAATKLGLTQPTLGKTIKDLEFTLEQKLFRRIPTGVEPTWRAKQLARLAHLFVAEIEQGLQEVNEFVGQRSGKIRIGSLPLARANIVPMAVLRLLEEYPQAEVSIVDGPYEEQLVGLLQGQVDIIVGALRAPNLDNTITQHKLFDDKLHVVARKHHPSLATIEEGTYASNISKWQWVIPKAGTPTRKVFNRMFELEAMPVPKDIIECSTMMAIRGILLKSDRVTLLSARQVQDEVDAGLLYVSPNPLPDSCREIGYTLRRDWQPTALQRRFLEVLDEYKRN